MATNQEYLFNNSSTKINESDIPFVVGYGFVYISNESPVTGISRVLTIIIGVAAMIVNAITILTIFCVRKLRKRQIVLIANLAVVDFIVGLSTAGYAIGHGKSDSISSLYAITNAMFSLTWVSVVGFERFLAIVVAPIRYRHVVTKCKLTIVCILLWAFSIIYMYGIIRLLQYGIMDEKYQIIVYYIYFLMICIIGITYLVIFLFVKRASNNFKTECTASAVRKRRLSSLFFTFTMLFGLLCICLLPNHIFMMYIIHKTPTSTTGTLNNTFQAVFYDISHLLLPLNSVINPFIYWWRITEFREGYKRVICCIVQKPDHSPSNSTQPICAPSPATFHRQFEVALGKNPDHSPPNSTQPMCSPSPATIHRQLQVALGNNPANLKQNLPTIV